MANLITKESAIEAVRALQIDPEGTAEQIWSSDAVDAIRNIKLSDAVYVVRCEDCQHWVPERLEEGDYSGHCRKRYGTCENQLTDAMWFCADGEELETRIYVSDE